MWWPQRVHLSQACDEASVIADPCDVRAALEDQLKSYGRVPLSDLCLWCF
jgi:hypothetical protein